MNCQKGTISEANFHIFRDGRTGARTGERKALLAAAIRDLASSPSLDDLLRPLLRAGELECALEDVGAASTGLLMHLTDALAKACLDRDWMARCNVPELQRIAAAPLDHIDDTAVTISTPEGFAYYAVHPLDYADLIERTPFAGTYAFVVGIRSIGTTLSAVVAAKLRGMGIAADRTTVRPKGHPYDRKCEFDPRQRQQIRSALVQNAGFVICDEGPGRSGSSLLSVAEALEAEGVSVEKILILCSHDPDVGQLCAADAMGRWSRYRILATGKTRRIPPDANEEVSGGVWREKFLGSEQEWPPAWTQMERLKHLSCDEEQLLKFEGHGHFGELVGSRNVALAISGFGPRYGGRTHGFGTFPLEYGRMGRLDDLAPQLLKRMAEYCAWRVREFAVSDADSTELQTMARVNYEREFGTSLAVDLPVKRPVVSDGRMQPYEWFCTTDGRWLKLDGATHGDDHFFPGPCDIAWDLAGAIVEWALGFDARESFLSQYLQLSGDDVAERIEGYEAAYSIFRLAWSRMAAASTRGTPDEERLLRDYCRYREVVGRRASVRAKSCV